MKYSVTIICLSAQPRCYEWDWGCVYVHAGEVVKKKWEIERCRDEKVQRERDKLHLHSRLSMFQLQQLWSTVQQDRAFGPSWEQEETREKRFERGKMGGGTLREPHGRGEAASRAERGWKGNWFIWERRGEIKAENEKEKKGHWGHKPLGKWEHWSSRGCREGKKEEKAARYSESLLEMINQLHWAELTSRGPVCKFSSCPNNPLQTHTRYTHSTHRDKSCTSSVPFNYSYGKLKISDLFQPVAHSSLIKTEYLPCQCGFFMLQNQSVSSHKLFLFQGWRKFSDTNITT